MKRVFLSLMFLILTTLICRQAGVFASEKPVNHTLNKDVHSGFIENKGQIIDQNNNPNPEVLFLLNTPGFNVQLHKGGFSYDVYKFTSPLTHLLQERGDLIPNSLLLLQKKGSWTGMQEIQYHRIDFTFLASNPDCVIEKQEILPYYHNYHTTSTPPEGINFVHSYQKITYRNIYPGIDLVMTNQDRMFKYNLVVHPGGKIGDIHLQIKGCEVNLSSTGFLQCETLFGTLDETIPESYITLDEQKKTVRAVFQRIEPGVYGILVSGIVPFASTLVIDPVPTRAWATYMGGSSSEDGNSTSVDLTGNVYLAGQTSSSNNIATSGAYQGTMMGGGDAFLSKFAANGAIQWSTYYGGTQSDNATICTCDNSGNVIMAGFTYSTTNISTATAFQGLCGGPPDGFVAKFNSAGGIIWGTYYGGSADDEIYGVSVDNHNNIYFAGNTASTNNISTPGTFQTTLYAASNPMVVDGFLAKFDSNGSRLWGTYYGGENPDNANSCSADFHGHVILCGQTMSAQNIFSPGAYQTVNNGGYDAFFALFDSTGQRTWGTFYGGPGNDEAYGCSISKNGNIIVTGNTSSTIDIASTVCYQDNLLGPEDAFIISFSFAGTRNWGTYFGGTGSDQGIGCFTDKNDYIFIAGSTTSANDIASANAYQQIYGGGTGDAFITKFSSSGDKVWGTYYGDIGSDDGNSCVVDTSGNIFLAGTTSSANNIASASGNQTVFGGVTDAFLVKFGDCQPPGQGTVLTGPGNACQSTPGLIYTVSPISGATGYTWSVPSGITIVSGSNSNQLIVDIGSTAVSGFIIVHGDNSCGAGDNDSLRVNIHPRPVPVITGPDTVCLGSTNVYYTAGGNTLYSWYATGGIFQGGTPPDSVNILWNALGSKWIEVNYTDPNGCDALIYTHKTITVLPPNPVSITITASTNNICAGVPVTYTAFPTNGGLIPFYQWKVNGVNSGVNSSTFTYNPANNDVVSCVLTSSLTSCISNNPATSNTITMNVLPNLPVSISITATQNPVCLGTTVTFTGSPTNGGNTASYQWFVNGVATGLDQNTFSYIPVNGDVVSCVLTSSAQCVTGSPATSNSIVMVVNNGLPAGVTISASSNPFCPGTTVTFTATPSNGGGNPTYQWKVNGINVGINSSTYTYNPITNDSVRCVMTSNLACVSGSPVSSAMILMNGNLAPLVTFTPCFDTITTVNAKPIKLKGGIPLGGTYSGPGVNSLTGTFNPTTAGAGTKTITYNYTNAALCTASNHISILNLPSSIFTCGNTLTDIRDSKTYQTIQIGGQCWFSKNLNYGTVLLSSQDQRDNCIPEKYCYGDNPVNCLNYGGLYQWDEMMQFDATPADQGFCPPGWHIPTENEWSILFANWTNSSLAGSPLKNSGYSGFDAFITGMRHNNRSWDLSGFSTFFWTSSSLSNTKAWAHGLNIIDASIATYPSSRVNAFSVRCVLD